MRGGGDAHRPPRALMAGRCMHHGTMPRMEDAVPLTGIQRRCRKKDKSKRGQPCRAENEGFRGDGTREDETGHMDPYQQKERSTK
jgi:hypothetical protein